MWRVAFESRPLIDFVLLFTHQLRTSCSFFLFRLTHCICFSKSGVKCPRGEMSMGWNVRGVKRTWGEMSLGWNVFGCTGVKCPGVKCLRGETSSGWNIFGVKCLWGEMSWHPLPASLAMARPAKTSQKLSINRLDRTDRIREIATIMALNRKNFGHYFDRARWPRFLIYISITSIIAIHGCSKWWSRHEGSSQELNAIKGRFSRYFTKWRQSIGESPREMEWEVDISIFSLLQRV